jgi:hypothetical protein
VAGAPRSPTPGAHNSPWETWSSADYCRRVSPNPSENWVRAARRDAAGRRRQTTASCGCTDGPLHTAELQSPTTGIPSNHRVKWPNAE